MNEGDVLYIPRGVMHDAYCSQEYSTHITFGVHTVSWADYIATAIELARETDVDFRAPTSIRPYSTSIHPDLDKLVLLELLARILKIPMECIERRLFMNSIDSLQNNIGNPLSSALMKNLHQRPTVNDKYISIEPNSPFRLVKGENKKWELWINQNSCLLTDKEARLLKRMSKQNTIKCSTVYGVLGKEYGHTFLNALGVIGLLSFSK